MQLSTYIRENSLFLKLTIYLRIVIHSRDGVIVYFLITKPYFPFGGNYHKVS